MFRPILCSFLIVTRSPWRCCALWQIGSQNGARACGFADAGGEIDFDRAAPELALVAEAELLHFLIGQ